MRQGAHILYSYLLGTKASQEQFHVFWEAKCLIADKTVMHFSLNICPALDVEVAGTAKLFVNTS